jgi:hypothetical protein
MEELVDVGDLGLAQGKGSQKVPWALAMRLSRVDCRWTTIFLTGPP